MNIYISNLNSSIQNEDLRKLFSGYGDVKSVEIVQDVFTGKSRGFGYVEMESDVAQKAIAELNNTKLNDLIISVAEAQPKKIRQGSYKVGSGPVDAYRFRKN